MLRLVALSAILGLFLSAASAQEVNGSISGNVTDPSGSPINQATVKLVSEMNGAELVQSTNVQGEFTFAAVRPGIYSVTVEHPGFKQLRKQHFELAPGDVLGVGTFSLPVGSVSDSVSVQSEGSMVQTATSERAGIITSNEIQDLTVLNRDFTSFAELQPGVVITVGAQVQTFSGNNTFNVNGGRSTGNAFFIDGVPSTNTNQGNDNTTISLDNTQTVEVKLTNYQAEYGRNNGFTVLAASKSGTQELHGSAYYYDRNEALNANNFFNNRSGIKQTPDRVSYAGVTLGGPLKLPLIPKNKLFFFVSSEAIRELRPKGLVEVTVPTALERQGDFTQSGSNAKPIAAGGTAVVIKDPTNGQAFPGDIVPATRIIPSMTNYLNLLPLPNYVTAADLAVSKGAYNYLYQESLNVPKWLDSGKLDYNFSDKTTMFTRFNWWYEDQQGNAVSASNTSWGWLPQHYTAITPSGALGLTHIFDPTLVLQVNLGYQRFNESGPPLTQDDLTARLRSTVGFTIPQLYPNSNPLGLVPTATFGVSDSANPSYTSRFPLKGVENTYNIIGSLTKVTGDHNIKIGIYPEHWAAMKGLNAANFAGNMNFSQDSNNPLDTGYAYSNALLGVLDQYTETSNRFPMYEYITTLEWYVQDTWKVRRNLTIDAGLRFGWGTPWHANHNQEAAWVLSAWNPSQIPQLIKPVLVSGKRMGEDPYTGAILPALTIGAIGPEAPTYTDGVVNRLTDSSYPEGMRTSGGLKAGPRLGFSWDPFGDGKTAIRMGGGVFYDFHEVDNFGYGYEFSTPPLQYNPTIYYSYLTNLPAAQGYVFPSNVVGFNPNRQIQTTYNFSGGVQREIGFSTVLDVAYVGSLGRHLIEAENLNSEPLGTDWQPQNLDATNGNKVLPSQFMRPYPGWGNITYYFYGGNSSYHSLQTQLRRRYKNNLTYGVIWTWSKAMDYADTETSSSTTQVSSLINPAIWNYGESGYDHTHILRFYWTYNVPSAGGFLANSKAAHVVLNGWQVSGIFTVQSGAPTGVGISYSPSQDVTGSATDSGRVILLGNPYLPAAQQGGPNLSLLNPASVAAPIYSQCETANPAFICWGNANKDVFRGPGINNWDTSLFKNFSITERWKAQFRVEAYNIWNHTQFTTVNTSATFNASGAQTNGTYGEYTAAGNPRQLQLALRLTF